MSEKRETRQPVQTGEDEDVELLFLLYEENFNSLMHIIEKQPGYQADMGIAQLVHELSEITRELQDLMPYAQILSRLLAIINDAPQHEYLSGQQECA